jgi:hypothetical protein
MLVLFDLGLLRDEEPLAYFSQSGSVVIHFSTKNEHRLHFCSSALVFHSTRTAEKYIFAPLAMLKINTTGTINVYSTQVRL